MDDGSCQDCEASPASYCWAWDKYLCENCRRRWTEKETRDGGRHPCREKCSCAGCRDARRTGVTFAPGGPGP